ncbi:response regulator [Massilia sp. W12]|uniref:response regulator n=1 Tax=Massilia sp. W12 TaxID=3126507 RepID=UPI0030D35BD3
MASVVLLEDDSDLCELYASALRLAGHQVHVAANSRGILNVLQAQQAQVLVTDLIMPGHEGIEGIFLARQKQGLRIIAISSNQEYLRLAENLVDVCLHKPFPAQKLQQKVEEVLSRRVSAADE